jgi:NAD(P)-dependent dehydrogenase (short-subunit alcohol dehydrogenase family)
MRRFYIGNYKERYILMTGSDSGFGNVAARRLDKLGCYVFAGCFTEAGGSELKSQCTDKLQVISLDVSSPESVRKAFDIVKSKLPYGKGLWGILNNAGVMGNSGPPEWLTIDDYKAVNSVNLYGMIDVTMTFLPLVKLARGRVVNTSSLAGRFASPFAIPYSVSKFGVEAFTDGLRRALHPFGIKASLIEPGAHRTNMTTTEHISSVIERTWSQASQDAKEEYGEVYYQYFKDVMTKYFANSVSPNVDHVVDAYVHALLGSCPRARYVVGYDAKFFFLPLQWMPEWLGDWLLHRLDSKPLPAALLKKQL